MVYISPETQREIAFYATNACVWGYQYFAQIFEFQSNFSNFENHLNYSESEFYNIKLVE